MWDFLIHICTIPNGYNVAKVIRNSRNTLIVDIIGLLTQYLKT